MSHLFSWTGRFLPRAASCGVLAAALSVGCTDSIAPAPTGQIDGNAGMAPQGFGNDVPRAPAGAPIIGSARGQAPSSSHEAPATTAPAVETDLSAKPGVDGKFYEVAASAGPGGPAGPVVEPDSRPEDAAAKASAEYPPLTTFDRSAAEQLPAPDATAAYTSIVDPAEGELPEMLKPIEMLTDATAITGVRFSSPAAAQAVVASRVTGATERVRLDRYDLTTGKPESKADLPDQAELIDVSPDGTRALVRLTFGLAPQRRPASSQTRLDVWELTEADGRHIVGWQLGEKEDGTPAVPIGAAFLDGDRVATLTDDGTLTLWNLAEQKAVYTVATGGRGPLLTTPGRKYLAVFTGTTFGAFDAATGKFRGLLTPPRPTLAACLDAAFSPDGERLAAVLRRPAQSILTWDVVAGRPESEIDAAIGLDRGLHFGSPGYLVAGGVLFDLARKKPVWLYVENANSRNIGVSPDLRHWVAMRPAFKEPVLDAVAAPTDEILAAASGVSDLAPPRLGPGDALAVRLELPDFDGDREAFETALAEALGRTFAARGLRLDGDADASLVITASERRTGETISFNNIGAGGDEYVAAHEIEFTVAVADETGKPLWSETGRVPPTYFLAKQDGKTLEQVLLETLWQTAPTTIAGMIDRSMPAYIRTVPPEETLGQTRLWAGVKDVSPPGRSQLASGLSETTGDAGIDAAPTRQPSMTLTVGSVGVRDLAVTPKPLGLLVTTSDDGTVRVFQPVAQSQSLKELDEVRSSGATKLAVYPDGSRFAFGTEGGTVRIYDLNRKRVTESYEGADGAVTVIAVTAEPTLVAGTQGGRVYGWTEGNRSSPTVLAESQAAVTGLAAVPYSNRIVAAWADGTAKLIDAGTGQIVQDIALQAGPIHGVAVSPDSYTAAFATESGGAVLVTLSSGTELARVDEGSITAVAYKPDGLRLATANRFGRIVLWTTIDREPDSRLEGAGGRVSSIVFSPDGVAVAAAVAGRKTVPVWNLSAPAEGESAAAPGDAHEGPARAGFTPPGRPRSGFRPGFAHSGPGRAHSSGR